MWSSLNLFSNFYAHFWSHPFEWDPSRKKFAANPKSRKLLSYFISMAIMGFVPLTCATLLTAQSLGYINLDLLQVLVTILTLLSVTITLATEWSLARNAADLELCSNYLTRLEAQIKSRKFKTI